MNYGAAMLYGVSDRHSIYRVCPDADLITMGINPSKRELHEGHYVTLYHMMVAMHVREQALGLIFVDDREFDSKKRTDRFENLYALSHPDVAKQIYGHIRSFVDRVADTLDNPGIPARILTRRMSDFMTDRNHDEAPNGSVLYNYIHTHHVNIMDAFSMNAIQDDCNNIVRPLCDGCSLGPRYTPDIQMSADALQAKCGNTRCDQHKYVYTVDPHTQNNWAMFYAVDPLRDVHLSRNGKKRVLHIFGGDYGMAWGFGGMPKAMRLSNLIGEISPDARVDHFVGPLLTRNHEKLAKSNGDRADVPPLHVLQDIVNSSSPVVDMSRIIPYVPVDPEVHTEEEPTTT